MRYIVTGVTVYGRRFRLSYPIPQWALAINLFRGSVWEENIATGKRRLIKRVWN